MTKWVYKWSNNGWTNSEGSEVANRDLIEEALNLDNLLKEKGDVYNVWMTGHLASGPLFCFVAATTFTGHDLSPCQSFEDHFYFLDILHGANELYSTY
jgi:hypothetical protein